MTPAPDHGRPDDTGETGAPAGSDPDRADEEDISGSAGNTSDPPPADKPGKPDRHGQNWSDDEDDRMFSMLKAEQSHEEVGRTLGRSAAAIRRRLEKLEKDRNAKPAEKTDARAGDEA